MASDTTSLGIDIGGTNIRVALVSMAGDILAHTGARSPADPQAVPSLLVDMIALVNDGSAKAIGIGVPGRVDFPKRKVLSGGYLNLAEVALAEIMEKATGLPVILDNDGNMALVAEMAAGAAKGQRNVTMLTIGTGIGGAIANNGQIFRGTTTAGQLGHLTVNVKGRLCACGRIGCVETESSGTALQRHLTEAGFAPGASADALWDVMLAGDVKARQVFLDWAGPLRSAIDTLCATVDPEMIVLGGGAGHAAVRALDLVPTRSEWYHCPVVAATLGDNAGVIGAALAGLDHAGLLNPRRHGKRTVLVNGVPASGKSSISRELGQRTGWPVLSLDTVKNPFIKEIKEVDRLFNRRLGIASYEAIWSLLNDFPDGSTIIVDAWFGFQPLELLDQHLKMAKVEQVAEIWCHAPGDVLAARYEARLAERPVGHPGASYIPELIELAKRATPTGRGPQLSVDTTRPVDHDRVKAFVDDVFAKP